ncbi:MAG TPA: SAF domain-containing protein, partial [Jiangellaceae bacterium]|nr:SAF domain-containing protein [Jiangellaceae bacterium]
MSDSTPLLLADCALLLRADDEVAVATRDLAAGTRVVLAAGQHVVTGDVPRGHKLAVRAVPAGAAVHKYGQSIGVATADIRAGDHVHSHNLGMDDAVREHEFGTARIVLPQPSGPARTFQGYRRSNGTTGTRNFVG